MFLYNIFVCEKKMPIKIYCVSLGNRFESIALEAIIMSTWTTTSEGGIYVSFAHHEHIPLLAMEGFPGKNKEK